MSQDYYAPWTDDGTSIATAFGTELPASMSAIISKFSGTSAPSTTEPFSWWADTTDNILKIRNAADSAWIEFAPLGVVNGLRSESHYWGSVTGAQTDFVLGARAAARIRAIGMVSTGTTSSSSGNELDFDLYNVTQTESLFSAQPGTYTSVGGIGGGSDFVANTLQWYTPDQNADISADDVLEWRITVTGSPTVSLTRTTVIIEWQAI